MPRSSWTGHLRLSLVSCPIYLTPATTETERIRLNQINPKTGNRISLKPVDAETGEPIDRGELVKGYEYDRGQYVTLPQEELDELQIESSKTLDLTQFVDRADIGPVHLDVPYYVYPDGQAAVETYKVIAHAMVKRKKAAIGRIVLSSRERLVAVEPFGGGLMMSTLRTVDELRPAEFDNLKGDVDTEMVDMAETIINRLGKKFDPSSFRDRYQDALRELVEAKMKGQKPAARKTEQPRNVINLMDALKRSLKDNGGGEAEPAPTKKRAKQQPDRRQGSMLLPVKGGGKSAQPKSAEKETARGRRKAS